MNLLITGGLGGLGRELANALSTGPGMRVITFSRRDWPVDSQTSPCAIHERGSILDSDRLVEVMRRHEINWVIHAAGLRTRECEANPELAREINVTGTRRVMQAANTVATVRRILFLSSAAVYGRANGLVDETRPVNPETNYARTKIEAEKVLLEQGGNAGIETVIVRPGFIFGPHAEGGLTQFLKKVVADEAAHLVFPESFHLHWAPGLCGDFATLLQRPLSSPCRVYHLPGFDSTCDQFAAALGIVVSGGSRASDFHLEPDPLAAVPGRLDWSRFENEFGPAKRMPFPEALRLTLDALRGPRSSQPELFTP